MKDAFITQYATVLITILGVAYPILMQVVSQLDSKYGSDHIVGLFRKEAITISSFWSLIAALFMFVLWTFDLHPLDTNIPIIDRILPDSSSRLFAAATIWVIVSFFFFVNKVLVYFTPTRLAPYLMEKHYRRPENLEAFEALSDILALSIGKHQFNTARTLTDFFYAAFQKQREEQKDRPIVYPVIYYQALNRAIEELAILKEKRNRHMEMHTSGSIWLLGEHGYHEISNETYAWMWANIGVAANYGREDLIALHWEWSSQYFDMAMERVPPQHDEEYSIVNSEEINRRNSERDRFLEFHYALGGLLLKRRGYGALSHMFSFTRSEPPRYPLLPDTMNEIFCLYFRLADPFNRDYNGLGRFYTFPGESGINAEKVAKYWTRQYLALLFIRQYTLHEYYVYMNTTGLPQLPSAQGEIRTWLNHLGFLRKLVEGHLKNEDFLKAAGFDFVTDDWCDANNKKRPLVFFDELKAALEEKYAANAKEIEISEERKSTFYTSSGEILSNGIAPYLELGNKAEIEAVEHTKRHFKGAIDIVSRDTFSEHPEASHMEYDKSLAIWSLGNFKEGLSTSFFSMATKRYVLSPEIMFKALDRLNLSDQHVVVSFGFDLDHYIGQFKTEGLTAEKYKNTPIYSFGTGTADSALFVLKRSDLPKISMKEVSEETRNKFQAQEIGPQGSKIYAAVLGLSENDALRAEYATGEQTDEQLKERVLTALLYFVEVVWKKNIQMAIISQYTPYRVNGIQQHLSDVRPLTE